MLIYALISIFCFYVVSFLIYPFLTRLFLKISGFTTDLEGIFFNYKAGVNLCNCIIEYI